MATTLPAIVGSSLGRKPAVTSAFLSRIGSLAFGLALFWGCDSGTSGNETYYNNGQQVQCLNNAACGALEVCSGNACKNYSGVRYKLSVLGAQVSTKNSNGEPWDVGGGLPDPQVCLYDSGKLLGCTPVAQDTDTADWNWSTEAFLYSNSELTLALIDADIADNDLIGSKQYFSLGGYLHAGGDTAMWAAGANGNSAMSVSWVAEAL
jgi:hypothetical protein